MFICGLSFWQAAERRLVWIRGHSGRGSGKSTGVEDGEQEAVLEATQRKLMEYSAADIARWHEIKGVYMQLADRNDLWAACTATGTHCTDDGFIDFRSWLISQGKDVYMQVLQDPDSLAEVEIPKEGADFEALRPMTGTIWCIS